MYVRFSLDLRILMSKLNRLLRPQGPCVQAEQIAQNLRVLVSKPLRTLETQTPIYP